MKVAFLNVNILRNEEHCQFMSDVSAVVAKHQAEALQVKSEFDALQTAHSFELSLLEIMTKSLVTNSLTPLNATRTGLYRGIYEIVDAHQYHFDPSMRAVSERLMLVFREYGSMVRKTYNAESAALTKLTREAKTIYMKDFAILGLSQWIEHLEQANNEFQKAMHRRYEESAGKVDGNMKEARTATDAAYFALCSKIDAFMLITNDARYDTLIKAMNAVIEKYANMLAIRKGKNAAKSDKNQSAE